jgi:hypothetical protein
LFRLVAVLFGWLVGGSWEFCSVGFFRRSIYNVYGECIDGSSAQLEGAKQLKAARAKMPTWASLGPKTVRVPPMKKWSARENR